MEEKNIKDMNINKDVINLIEVSQKLWKNRKFIIKVTVFFAIIGFIVAISIPNVYTATCTMVPQTGQKNTGGNLGGLAAMAGINLGILGSGESLSPTVYPIIMTNINFQKELIYSKFHFKGHSDPLSLYDFYTYEKNNKFNIIRTLKKYTIGLPEIIIGAFKDYSHLISQNEKSPIQSLSKKEELVIKFINKNLSLTVNNKDGYISLSSEMSEPLLAAELVQTVQELLQKYITEFKIEKVTSNLQFVEKNYEESKRNFESKQIELAKFRDSNKSFSSEIAKTQEQTLIAEYTLLLGIYTELAKQKEQAKIAITETVPILTIIEPVSVPNEKSKPSRAAILFSFVFLGIAFGIGIVFIIPYLQENLISNIRKYWIFKEID